MSEKKEITIEHHSPSDPEISNCGCYLLSNGVQIFFSDVHQMKTDEEAKEFVDLVINAQKMRDMLERVASCYLEDAPEIKSEIKELIKK